MTRDPRAARTGSRPRGVLDQHVMSAVWLSSRPTPNQWESRFPCIIEFFCHHRRS